MEKSFIFNSINGDRKYKAEDFVNYFSKFITNGVFPNIASYLQVVANGTDMTVKLKAGAAWINGRMYENTDDLTLPIEVADGTLNRIDRVVIQLNYTNREILAKVKKGAFGSSPVAPTLQRDADVYELGIADIAVNKGITSITQSLVTDLRLNTTYCGMVNSLLQADTTAIFNQFQDWFNNTKALSENEIDQFIEQQEFDFLTWFNSIKDQLSGDVATNLANEITSHKADIVKHITAAERTSWNSKETTSGALAKVERDSYKTSKSNKDLNGIYTTVEHRRKSDNTLVRRSVLSGGTSPQYTTRTVTFFDTDGTTVVDTKTFTLTYDSDGDLKDEV